MRGNTPTWTQAEDEHLLKLWDDGLTVGELARDFPGRSRNACIGRLTRLRKKLGTNMVHRGASLKPKGEKKKRQRRANFSVRNKGAVAVAATPIATPAAPPTARMLPLLELGPKDCRFIVTDHQTRKHLYCAADASANVDDCGNNCYCSFHQRLMRAH